MVVGGGQLAKAFSSYKNNTDVVIFASGVSNSNCTGILEFKREESLLVNTLKENENKIFVYFSSCALSAEEYPKNAYYDHKAEMERVIQKHSNNYLIFRVPQLFGKLIPHGTLINFIYGTVKNEIRFEIYDNAYRYVIEINDVVKLVTTYIQYSANRCSIIDIANTYRYSISDIVNVFEKLLNKKANVKLVHKEDQYTLDLTYVQSFIVTNNIDIHFGKDYLEQKLKEKIKAS